MKKTIAALVLGIAVSGFAQGARAGELQVVAVCGPDYRVMYAGDRTSTFSGVQVTQSEFVFEKTHGPRVFADLSLHSEGGSLTAEYKNYVAEKEIRMKLVYTASWGRKSLQVSVNGTVTEEHVCKDE